MGAEVTEKVIEWCYEIGVKQLTLYAFSTENFQRSEEEVDGLFVLINEKFKKLYSDSRTYKKEMQVRVIGDRSKLPAFLNESIDKIETATAHHTKFHLKCCYCLWRQAGHYSGCKRYCKLRFKWETLS